MSIEPVSRHDDHQRLAWIGGTVHRVVFDGSATEGRLTAFRSTMRAGAASPIHVHDHEDETFFLLDGAGVFWVGAESYELTSGDSLFLPRGVPHAYAFTADTDMLTVCNPSGTEEFFRSVGWDLKEPLPEGWAVDMEALRAAGEATGQHVLGPPLAPGDAMPDGLATRR